MFLGRQSLSFVTQHFESPNQARPGISGFDDIIYQPEFCCPIWVVEGLFVFIDQFGAPGFGIIGVGQHLSMDDVNRPWRSHDGDLGRGPSVHKVGPNSSGIHKPDRRPHTISS